MPRYSWRRAGRAMPRRQAYARVADHLEAVCAAWPFLTPIPTLEVRRTLADELAAARDAEAEAIHALKAVVRQGKVARV